MIIRNATSRMTSRAVLSGLLVLTAGCTALLPKSENITRTPWGSFDEARAAYERIVPNRTTEDDLRKMGFDPFSNANITILSYSDILKRFVPSTAIDPAVVDGAVRDCLVMRELCYGYEVETKNVMRNRTGNFFLDFLNFERRTEVTGWRFSAFILINDKKVVHKLWSGQPVIREYEESKNPLGPLQSYRP